MTKSFPTRRAYDVGLAVGRRTVESDDHRRIAMGRERLGIPAIGPAIAEAALRPAMDQHGYRQLACYTLRLHDLAPDGVAVRALEAVALDRDVIDPGQLFRIDGGKARRLAQRLFGGIGGHFPEIGGRLDAVERVDEAAPGQRDRKSTRRTPVTNAHRVCRLL